MVESSQRPLVEVAVIKDTISGACQRDIGETRLVRETAYHGHAGTRNRTERSNQCIGAPSPFHCETITDDRSLALRFLRPREPSCEYQRSRAFHKRNGSLSLDGFATKTPCEAPYKPLDTFFRVSSAGHTALHGYFVTLRTPIRNLMPNSVLTGT